MASATSAAESRQSQLLQNKPKVVFVLGGPGSGKGTHSKRLATEFGFKHLSAGELLRDELRQLKKLEKLEESHPDRRRAEMIKHCIDEGKIVPVAVTVQLLLDAMRKHNDTSTSSSSTERLPRNRFLIDGFPRNQDNLDGWNEHAGKLCEVPFILHFKVPHELLKQRLMARLRGDDNPEAIDKRIATYEEQTKPIVQHFEELGRCREVEIKEESPIQEVYAQKVRSHFLDFDQVCGDAHGSPSTISHWRSSFSGPAALALCAIFLFFCLEYLRTARGSKTEGS